jgi:hypothetical protein
MATYDRDPQVLADMDSLHILPLSLIPVDTPGLRRARLIKNSQLESVIELYRNDASGSGQLAPNQLAKAFKWKGSVGYEDKRVIESLGRLNSYDVYCLRIDLRRLGIEVNDYEELRLSNEKRQELHHYMRSFTSPLLKEVYGSAEADIKDIDQLLAMFSNPNKESAIKNLRKMADRLDIDIEGVPLFLEEYGDIFLSLAYYRHCLDELIPIVKDFIEAMHELKDNLQMRRDAALMQTCTFMENRLSDITTSITGRFDCFDSHSRSMWDNLSADEFHRVRNLIEDHHATVGGVLCGLSVKMNLWENRMGRSGSGPMQRAEFIMSHMKNGMDKIQKIEDSAPVIHAL